jgi:hypothetical protein
MNEAIVVIVLLNPSLMDENIAIVKVTLLFCQFLNNKRFEHQTTDIA